MRTSRNSISGSPLRGGKATATSSTTAAASAGWLKKRPELSTAPRTVGLVNSAGVRGENSIRAAWRSDAVGELRFLRVWSRAAARLLPAKLPGFQNAGQDLDRGLPQIS